MTMGRTHRSAGPPMVDPRRSHARSRLDQSARAVVARAVPPGQRVDRDARARVRSVDEAAAADVDPDVTQPVEEDEIPGPERAARHPPAAAELTARIVRKHDAEMRVDEAREAGAVEAA